MRKEIKKEKQIKHKICESVFAICVAFNNKIQADNKLITNHLQMKVDGLFYYFSRDNISNDFFILNSTYFFESIILNENV